MHIYLKKTLLIISLTTLTVVIYCKKNTDPNGNKVYFGGEIINPNSKFVYLCKENIAIDTIELDNNNRFLKEYDSLTPGMYTFKHEPEYQYIYFNKNDSLMIRLNTNEFDNSLTFCGRGDEKNNFLIDLFLKNEVDKNTFYDLFDKDQKTFLNTINKEQENRIAFYNRRKKDLNWNDDFDTYAKAMLEMHYLSVKELYPARHKNRTNEDVCKKLPSNYYNHRNDIDFNNQKLTNFSPFVHYLTNMLNNMCYEDSKDSPLENNIKKLNVADTLFTNKNIKNTILNKIAFIYLLEDQNIANNKKFIDKYLTLSTDSIKQTEIKKIGEATQMLTEGKSLPEVNLIDFKGNLTKINSLFSNNTVVFFWTSDAKSHLELVHKKVMELKSKYPKWNFISININDSKEKWLSQLSKYSFKNTIELHALNFDDIKSKWVIIKIHRAMLINKGGSIKNAFVSILDPTFEDHLK